MLKLPAWFKDFAFSFSLANLCYFRSWTALQQVHGGDYDYFSQSQRGFETEILTVVNVLLLTGILRLLLTIVRESKSRAIRLTAGLFLAGAFLTAAPQLFISLFMAHPTELSAAVSRLTPQVLSWLVVPPVLVAIVLVIGSFRIAVKAASAFTIFMFPRAIINVLQVAWWVFSASPSYAYVDHTPMAHAPLQRLTQPGRVVWVIFDELDQNLSFENRPGGLQLNELDRLRANSIFASAAQSPAADTKEAIPSLLAGRAVEETDPAGASELMLRYKGQSGFVPWSREGNIFRSAHQLGLKTALDGWYHPYCRVIGNDLDSCAWRSLRDLSPGFRWKAYTESLGIIGALANQLSRELAAANPFAERIDAPGTSPEEKSLARSERLYMMLEARGRALSLAADPKYDVVFLHLPIPHPPSVYDGVKHAFNAGGHQNYIDSLQGTDDLLKEMRVAMEAAGLWDSTALLISSDHPLRQFKRSDFEDGDAQLGGGVTHPYVPFLLKLPHQKAGLAFNGKFNTVHSGAILERVLRRELTTPEQAAGWMSAHSDN
jgi:hypothetical protein